jgi:Family of unknown function (DUF6286)
MKLINRLLALLLSLAVIAAAVILIIEVIAERAAAAPAVLNWHRVYHWADTTSWNAGPIRAVSIVLVIVGLGIVGMQLKPRRPEHLAVTSGTDATDTAITHQGVAHRIRHTITNIDGVDTATVAVGRRHIKVRARIHPDQAAIVDRDIIAQTAQTALDSLHLATPPSVSVHMATKER